MIETLEGVFFPIAVFIPLVPVIAGLIRRKSLKREQVFILLLVFIASGINLYSTFQSHFHVENNMPSLHLLTVLEFICIAGFFYQVYPLRFKRIVVYSATSFVLLSLLNTYFVQGIESYNSYARGLESFLLVTYSMLFFLWWIKQGDLSKIPNSSRFYITTGILFYFSATQFLFLFENQLSDQAKWLVKVAFQVHYLVVIVYYSLLAIGLWKKE